MNKINVFENKKVRTAWNEETGLKVVSELNAKDKLALEINNKSIENK